MGAVVGDDMEVENHAGRRRWPWVVAATLVAIIGALAIARWVWFPHYRPSLGEGDRYGLDVSNHQGEIDWERVARDDIEFVYVKATEGGDFVDARFDENWDRAGAAGLDRGAYHFFTLCRPGVDQARNFLEAVPHEEAELPLAVDLELPGNCSARPPADDVLAEVEAFVDAVEAETGSELVVYVLSDFHDRYPVLDRLDRPRWERRILLRPGGDWFMWQFTGEGEVDGVSGGVDINVMHGAGQ